MGSFLFKWEQPANEVYVTGTFDDWAKSVRLEKKRQDLFEKVVELPQTEENIYYKFVVDTEWTIDTNAPQERDGASNINNVLTPQKIRKSSSSSKEPGAVTMSGVNPQLTTAGLASNVPKGTSSGQESRFDSPGFPGAFPETPADETTGFSVKPIPQTPGGGNPIKLAPGEKVPDPSTLTSNTISSTARDDTSLAKKSNESEQTFGISPLPATSGAGNPIQLEPGEKVPPSNAFTRNTIDTFVTTDEESYNRGSGPPRLPDVVTPQIERNNRENGLFNLPAISGSTIPESSLPLFGTSREEQDPGVTIQSAGANSSTAALAGQVPLEPRGVPEVISQDEGSSNQERDPALKNQTSAPTQSTTDETSSESQDPRLNIGSVGPSSTTADLAGEVPLAPHSSPRRVPESRQGEGNADGGRFDDVTIQSVGAGATTAGLAGNVPLEPRDPTSGVSENQQNLNDRGGSRFDDVTIQSTGPNATTAGLAGNVPLEPRNPISGVSENQQNLNDRGGSRFDDVTIQSAGPNATTAGLAGDVPLEPRSLPRNVPENDQDERDTQGGRLGNVTIQSTGANATTAGLAANVPLEPRGVPEIVQESQQAAGFAPEASANPEALREKAALEEELEGRVSKEPATSEGIGGGTAGGAPSSQKAATGSTSLPLPSRGLPASIRQSIDEINRGTTAASTTPGVAQDSVSGGNQGIAIAPTVPDVVQESIAKSNQSPEAAASAVVVDEKKAVESELLSHIKPEEASGEPAPSASAALSEEAPAPTTQGNIKDVGSNDVVAPNPSSRAPARSALQEALQSRNDSRDISPMSHPSGGPPRGSQPVPQVVPQTAPQEGNPTAAPRTSPAAAAGVAPSSTTPKSRAEPVPGSSASRSTQATSEASASSDKKSKRASGFFGKLKSKFSHKD